MTGRLNTFFLIVAGLLTISLPLLAHHGTAAYDTKTIVLNATVTEWIWANPHCILKFDAKDDAGNLLHWSAEVSNPADMVKRGWQRHSFKPGDAITVSLQQVKNGSPVGRILHVTLASGQVLSAEGPAPAPAPSPDTNPDAKPDAKP